MALVLRNIFTWLYNTHNYHDPQLDDYPIINYAFFGIIISVIYLKLVTSILPAFMKNREPFNLKPFILAYNAFQVLFNGLLLIKGLPIVIASGFTPFQCFGSDIRESRPIIILYLFNKLADCIETVVFVLRKKNGQVSALHLIHHVYILTFAHYAIFWEQHGFALHASLLNAAVHILMYFYYSVNAYGIKSRWTHILKKSTTKVQMIQFVVDLIMSATVFLPDCKVAKHKGLISIHLTLLMYFMFYSFYRNAYNKNVKQKHE